MRSLSRGTYSSDKNFIQRWPSAPKVAFFGPPNVFQEEIIKRFSIDLGLPILSMQEMLQQVADHAGSNEEYNHSFFLRVRDMINAGDADAIHHEKIPLKLLRLTAAAQDGFILTDFPANLAQAEQLEEYKGGMNAFVHLTLPDEILVDIEESKMKCSECDRLYYKNDVID